jgi:ABC-type bacteriocin/lantibiotic exporter with double-glycine peptidase domain
LPYVHSVLSYLDEIPKSEITYQPLRQGFHNELRLEKISFRYHGASRNALSDIDLTIRRGQTIGIIGASGAGKSTLVDVIIGLLPPSTGRILLDGKEMDGPSMRAWEALIGYVPQTPYIAPASLAENVAFGLRHSDIDYDKVLQCCRLAAMGDYLHQLPDGLNTFIGERGVKLSGGQRQRVAIARALYHDPEVIIFDEATSALDSRNEESIQKTIYSLKNKQTLIIIAHRLSTVEGCDEIIWLENGKIEMTGSASKVLERYRRKHSDSNSTPPKPS